MTGLEPYVEARLRRALPDGIPVVHGSTPVLAVGDPSRAWVATLGLNPSRAEFLNRSGQVLSGAARRLVDLPHLGVASLAAADPGQLQEVIDGCDSYFDRAPFWRWFRPLETLISKVFDASYRDRSACHLDLSQWATDPVWNGLNTVQRSALLAQDAPFLAQQLEQENVSVLLLNGRSVIDQARRAGLADLTEVGTVRNAKGTMGCRIFHGVMGGTTVYGWSSNLQSQPGVDAHLKDKLAEVLADFAVTKQTGDSTVTQGIAEGTEVQDKQALAELLRTWWRTTNEPTIGDVAQYVGRPYVHVHLDDVHLVLNADTKRAAVERYLRAVDDLGPDLQWQVVKDRTKINKVVYEGMDTSAGWYAYTSRTLEAPRWL